MRDLFPDDMDRRLNLSLNLKNLARSAGGRGESERAAGLLEFADRETADAVERFNRHPGTLAVRAEILAARQQTAEARKLLAEVEAIREGETFFPAAWVARVHVELGEIDRALELLAEAERNQEGNGLLYNLRKPGFMEKLVDQRGYWDLIEKMNYPALPPGHPFHDKEREMRFNVSE